MIDANLLRENPEAIKASQRARGASETLVDDASLAGSVKARRSPVEESKELQI